MLEFLSNTCQWVVPVRFLRVEAVFHSFVKLSFFFDFSKQFKICRSRSPFSQGSFLFFSVCLYKQTANCISWQLRVWLSLINVRIRKQHFKSLKQNDNERYNHTLRLGYWITWNTKTTVIVLWIDANIPWIVLLFFIENKKCFAFKVSVIWAWHDETALGLKFLVWTS